MDFFELIKFAIDFVIHLDKYLSMIINWAGAWTYAVLFVVIFIETGLVVTPFLPGDSLLFAAGTFAALGDLNPFLMWFLLSGAAILGDTANYWIGHFVGEKAFTSNSRLIKKEYLERTHAFYEKHGGKTIFLARFIPIIRTFAPFVAGIGRMRYGYFISYNVFGGLIWPGLFIFAGYFFGNVPVVKENFSLVIIAIIVISVIPAVVEALRGRKAPAKAEAEVG
ncbi:MAG: DedA family protein [Anaerolineales bacterium]|jgi:membrane-associated protein